MHILVSYNLLITVVYFELDWLILVRLSFTSQSLVGGTAMAVSPTKQRFDNMAQRNSSIHQFSIPFLLIIVVGELRAIHAYFWCEAPFSLDKIAPKPCLNRNSSQGGGSDGLCHLCDICSAFLERQQT